MALLFSANLILLGLFFSVAFNIDTLRFPFIARWLPNPSGVSLLLILGAMLSLLYLFPDGAIQPRWLRWLQLPAPPTLDLVGALWLPRPGACT